MTPEIKELVLAAKFARKKFILDQSKPSIDLMEAMHRLKTYLA